MENNCLFVCSRGILKSCDFHSNSPISSWCYDVNYLSEMVNSNNMFDTMSIYICTDVIPHFINNILPKLNNTFYLVSGDSDATVYGSEIDIYHGNPKILDKDLCYILINNPLLIKWYAQNCIIDDCKVVQMPIGMDYHTILNDPHRNWIDFQANEGILPKFQEKLLKDIRKNMKPFHERINRVFITCNVGKSGISSELISENNDGSIPRSRMWKKMVDYTFIYAPYRGGIDSHRQWESLLLGCIPIVQTTGTNKLFEDLPVLIVNDYSEVTKELLDTTLEKFKSMEFNYDKLLLRYWVEKFNSLA